MKRHIGSCLLLLAFCLSGIGPAQAQQQMYQPEQLPSSAWAVLKATRGVQVGGGASATANVHVIFDAHCPYCAKLYERLERDYPNLVVRWVPVAYFKDDSAKVAAAILASNDPAASLSLNFDEYDFDRRRGGFRPPPYQQFSLGPAHRTLQQHWLEWGGYTPMIIVKTGKGHILKAEGSSEAFLDHVLDRAARSAERSNGK